MKYNKRIWLVIFVCIPAIFLACATHYDTKTKGRIIVTEMTNIKAQPSFSAADIATVDRGTTVMLVERREAWYKVKMPNAQYGWIHESVVKPESFKSLILSQDVKMRYRPDKYGAVMMTIPKGTQIKELERRGEWVKIEAGAGNNIGWAARSEINSASVLTSSVQGVRLYTKSGANIRTGPGRRYDKITTVKGGTRLGWRSTAGDWYQVQYRDRTDAYIWKELVTRPPYRRIHNKKRCDVKSAPSAASSTVETLPEPYANLKKLDTRSGWYLVELPSGSLGWINRNDTTEPTSSEYTPDSGKFSLPFGLYFAIKNASIHSNEYGSGSIVANVSAGTHLKLKNYGNEWCHVELPDGKTGYISNHDFAGVKDKYLVTKGDINVREGPGKNYKVIEKRAMGLDAILTEVQNDWCRVAFVDGGREGWVWSQLLLPSKYRVIFVTKADANVRRSNNTSGQPLDKYDSGIEITYVEKRGDWYKFNPLVPNYGSVGWINEKVASVPKYGFGVAIRDDVIRLGPSERDEVLYNLKAGSELPVIEQKGAWYRVEMPDTPRMGYIRKYSLEKSPYSPLIAIRNSAIRSKPLQNSGTITSIDPGTELTVLQEANDWYRVKLITIKRNFFGWIHRADAVEPNFGTISIPESRNIRYGPGKEYGIRSVTSNRRQCKILDYDGKWYQIKINNVIGWVYYDQTWADDATYY